MDSGFIVRPPMQRLMLWVSGRCDRHDMQERIPFRALRPVAGSNPRAACLERVPEVGPDLAPIVWPCRTRLRSPKQLNGEVSVRQVSLAFVDDGARGVAHHKAGEIP